MTAVAVTAIKAVSKVLSITTQPYRNISCRPQCARLRNVGRRALSFLARSFAIGLPPGFIRRTNLVLLLAQIVAAFVGPRPSLCPGLARAFANGVGAVLSR